MTKLFALFVSAIVDIIGESGNHLRNLERLQYFNPSP